VHRLLETPALAEYQSFLGRESVKRAVERELDRARVSGGEAGTDGMHAIVASVCERLDSQRRATLMRAINATGVIVHTNWDARRWPPRRWPPSRTSAPAIRISNTIWKRANAVRVTLA